jgi:o-succinylbenzoate---CoA ligase
MPSWKSGSQIFPDFPNFPDPVIQIWLNGVLYSPEQILSGTYSGINQNVFEKKVLNFIRDWNSGKEQFVFNTSGSTGRPKTLSISREKMLLSARSTLQFLGLKEGKCLLCLDPAFIAGAMMIVRAFIGRMDLIAVEPAANPLKEIPLDTVIDLCAIVPLQLAEIWNDPDSRKKFGKIRNVLIGGADLSEDLAGRMAGCSNRIYHTFGMTETVTHIALKKLSGEMPDDHFQAVNGVEFSADDRGCLIIKGPITENKPLITNDRVELIDRKRFRWLGRIDHVINSGGIKIQLETLEKKIDVILKVNGLKASFFLTGIPDEKLGEKLAIVFETGRKKINKQQISVNLANALSFHEIPRSWHEVPAFVRTSTGKVNRIASLGSSREIS